MTIKKIKAEIQKKKSRAKEAAPPVSDWLKVLNPAWAWRMAQPVPVTAVRRVR